MNKKVISAALFMGISLVFLIGVSYSFFTSAISGNSSSLITKTASLGEVEYTTTSPTSNSSVLPGWEGNGTTSVYLKTTSTEDIGYFCVVALTNDSMSSDLYIQTISGADGRVNTRESLSTTGVIVSSGTLSAQTLENNSTGTKHDVTYKIIFDETGTNQNTEQNMYIKTQTTCYLGEYAGTQNYIATSGNTGDASWSYNSNNKTLTITGTGAMEDYTIDSLPPWYVFKDDINKIVIDENVTYLGKYSFYNLTDVQEFRIDAISLRDLYIESANVGNNYALYHVGANTLGTRLIFGSKVTVVPSYLTRPTGTDGDAPNFNDVVFEGNSISSIRSYGLSNLKMTSLKIPAGVTKLDGISIGRSNSLVFIVLPHSVTRIEEWAFNGNSKVEKIVFGNNVSYVKGKSLRNNNALKIVVLPSVSDTASVGTDTFYNDKGSITVYGGVSTSTWLTNVLSASGQSNVSYSSLDDNYRCQITSNTGISTEVSYNGTYTFEATGEVNIRMYYEKNDGTRYYVDADYQKSGNTYTISNIVADIYITIN